MKEEPFLRYIFVCIVSTVLLVGHIFLLNYLYDPWWHFGGNKVGVSYSFHERESKINRLKHQLSTGESFNCVVLGSSRILTFDHNRIQNFNCYNYSISSGNYPRLISYLRQMKDLGQKIELIVMGIDNWQFTRKLTGKRKITAPPEPAPWYEIYFGLDALRYSKRIANQHRVIIGYLQRWVPTVGWRSEKAYPIDQGWSAVRDAFEQRKLTNYYPENLEWLSFIGEVFPQAQLAGFITPLSPDLLVKIHAEGGLENHILMAYEASKYFDTFFDFALPNRLTRDPKNSWDGSHYKPWFTDYIVRTIFEGESNLAVNTKAMSLDEYRSLYKRKITKQMMRAGLPQEYLPS